MSRIIRGQVLTGSGPDSEGPGIDREVIKHLYGQIASQSVGGVDHDLSREPVVRAFNYRLEESHDGELVIKADVEVLDEQAFSQMGGFSISFTRKTTRIGQTDHPALQVLINPKHFDYESLTSAMAQIVPTGHTVDVTERIEKGAVIETAIIIVMLYTLSEVTKGFLSAAGSDLYDLIKGLKRKDEPNGPISIQLRVDKPMLVILDVASSVTSEEFKTIDIPDLSNALPPEISLDSVARIVCRVEAGPSVYIKFVVLINGISIEINGPAISPDEA